MKLNSLKLTVAVGALLTAPLAANALTIEVNDSADALTGALFLNVPGLTVLDSGLSGGFNDLGGQAGLFENESGTYGLPNSGIVISSGNVADYADGPNDFVGTSTSFSGFGFEGDGPGEDGEDIGVFFVDGFIDDGFVSAVAAANGTDQDLLGPITGQPFHNDVVRLSIDFEAGDDIESVTFFATFGSEEFPEYVSTDGNPSDFTDGFGLFVNGQNFAGVQPAAGGANQPVNIDHPDMVAFAGTELDGVLAPNGNPVLQFDVDVQPGQVNNFTIILGDASDDILDTTTYISSFIPTVIANPGTGNPTVNDGGTEFTPLLPSNPVQEDGFFVIELPVNEDNDFQFDVETTIWVDPPVAVGYTYSLSGGALIASITAPSGATVPDSDGYTVTFNGNTQSLAVGETKSVFDLFGVAGISNFTLEGIDEALMLEPLNPLAFPIGLNFSGDSSNAIMTISAITVDDPNVVPLPGGAALYLTAF